MLSLLLTKVVPRYEVNELYDFFFSTSEISPSASLCILMLVVVSHKQPANIFHHWLTSATASKFAPTKANVRTASKYFLQLAHICHSWIAPAEANAAFDIAS